MNPTRSPIRVALVGAESTGKTTMATALAQHFHTRWVPEYWRLQWEGKRFAANAAEWTDAEFIHAAAIQSAMEEEHALRASKVLICDTDCLMVGIWQRRYLGRTDPAIQKLAADAPRHLILHCRTDCPFVQDGVRDGEHIRQSMESWIEEGLVAAKRRVANLTGDHHTRFNVARSLIDELLAWS